MKNTSRFATIIDMICFLVASDLRNKVASSNHAVAVEPGHGTTYHNSSGSHLNPFSIRSLPRFRPHVPTVYFYTVHQSNSVRSGEERCVMVDTLASWDDVAEFLHELKKVHPELPSDSTR